MKITKIGHCCLVIETNGKRIMTDPGSFTADSHVLDAIDLVLITHEHADHVHVPSLTAIVAKNPEVTIVTNSSVGKLLDEAGIAFETLEGSAVGEFVGLVVEACDAKHAEIFETMGQVQNTGYFIDKRLFYPGDAYAEIGKAVEILALPLGDPWCRTTDAFHYALTINPKYAFPVHDGIEREDRTAGIHGMALKVLGDSNIEFKPLRSSESLEF